MRKAAWMLTFLYLWYAFLKDGKMETDPEKFSRLPDMRANGNNRWKPMSRSIGKKAGSAAAASFILMMK